MDTPVLLIVFNRPAQTRAAIERLKRIGARRLYIAADGPRAGHPTDAERCAEVRSIISALDRGPEVKYLLRDANLGCKRAVGEALGWLFDQEDRGIILEDDIDPDPSFFPFCDELLERYKDDERIGIISGCNFTSGEVRPDASYFFLRNLHMWGWATWRRVWRLVDLDMSDWNDRRSADFIRRLYGAPWATQQAWERHFDNAVNRRRTDVWDYQVCYALWRRGMLGIAPAVNLIDNDGFGADATHPSAAKPRCLLDSPRQSIGFPLQHPAAVTLHPRADRILDRDAFGIAYPKSVQIFVKMQLRRARHLLTGRYA